MGKGGVGTRKASPSFLVPVDFQETAGWGSGVSFSRNVAFAKIGPPKGVLVPLGGEAGVLAVAHKLLRERWGGLGSTTRPSRTKGPLDRQDSINPHLYKLRALPVTPHLGLRNPPGHTILTLLLHRLDPKKLQEALLQVFPEADLGGVLVVDGKHLRGSGKGKSPQVRLVEVLALHLKTTLAQARVEGREDQALLELLDRLGAEGLKGKVVVGDAGYLYPEVAGKVVEKGGHTSSS